MNENADDDNRMISSQQPPERVQMAYREWLAKDTRKGRASAAKRSSMLAAVGAWLVRMIGAGGGI